MANYPTGKDDLKTDIQGTDPMANHAELHNLVNDAVNAIQDFVGVSGGSEPNTITGAINIIAETVEAIETYLDITINDGVANPGDNPNFLPVGASTYEDAYTIQTEIDALKAAVNDLAVGEGVDLTDYLEKGADLSDTINSAADLEKLITANTASITELTAKVELNSTTINNLAGSLGLEINLDGSVIIDPNPNPDAPPIVDVSGFATKTEVSDGDTETLTAANDYTDSAVSGISVDTSDLALQDDLDTETQARIDGDATLQANIDAIDVSTKFDKGATTYIDAKAIQDDIDGIESSISDLSDNYDQLVSDLGNAGGDLTVELAGYLKKGTASYADAAGIEAEIDQEKNDRVAGDEATLTSANSYTDDEIAKVVIPDVSDLTTKDYVDTADATKFDKGATTYADAKEIEDAIKANAESIDAISSSGGYNDAWIQPAIDAGDSTTLTSANTYTDEEVAKIVVPDVSDLATKDELTAGLATKADEPHTHADLAAGDHNHDSDYSAADHNHDADYAGKTEFDAHTHDTTHNHDAEYQPVGDYATNSDLTSGLAGKSDTTHDHFGEYAGKAEFDAHHHDGEYSVEGHTHDTTHDHDADYQPVGDYATKTELAVVDGKADANTSKNTEQDGKIAALESANQSLDSKVEALENALVSAKYNVEIATGQAPREGYVRLDDGDPNSISLMVFNPKDANGNQHDFSGVKDGDKLTVATNSAVGTYNILSATTGSLSVAFISGNGTFSLDDVVDVKVSPEFDASSYATTTYVDAQDATKFDKGATGPTTYTTAELMEAAIDTNKAAINANADVIDGKLDRGEGLVAANAKDLENAIGANKTKIDSIVEGLGGDIENIEVDALPEQTGNDGKFLTTDGSDASWAEIPDGTDENAVHTLENADSPTLKCTGIMALTQAQYDALDGSRDPEVLYLVVD